MLESHGFYFATQVLSLIEDRVSIVCTLELI